MAAFVLAANAGLAALLVLFSQRYWWAFSPVLALGSATMLFFSAAVVLNVVFWHRGRLEPALDPVLMFVTAYREPGPDLEATIQSLVSQDLDPRVERAVVVAIDGERETAAYARTLDAEAVEIVPNAYSDWLGASRDVEFRRTTRNGIRVVFLIKSANSGKRDTVTLVRTLARGALDGKGDYALPVSSELEDAWRRFVPIKAVRIAGADADTVFAPSCVSAMLEEMNAPGPRPVDGVVGVIRTDSSKARDLGEHCFVAFQEVGYCIGQCFMRAYQSRITEKVSCLSGACYVVYVPTMCSTDLLRKFNAPPAEDAGLYESILSFASEDRRAVCIALSEDGGVRFRQALDPRATAYTAPPTDLRTFLSQRRRWSLGSLCNNIWLALYGRRLLLVERIVALFTVVGWFFTPLYAVANFLLIFHVVGGEFSLVLFYVSLPMIFVWIIELLNPLVSPYFSSWKDRLAFYPKYALYFAFGPWVSLLIQFNSLFNAHSVSWGKTSNRV